MKTYGRLFHPDLPKTIWTWPRFFVLLSLIVLAVDVWTLTNPGRTFLNSLENEYVITEKSERDRDQHMWIRGHWVDEPERVYERRNLQRDSRFHTYDNHDIGKTYVESSCLITWIIFQILISAGSILSLALLRFNANLLNSTAILGRYPKVSSVRAIDNKTVQVKLNIPKTSECKYSFLGEINISLEKQDGRRFIKCATNIDGLYRMRNTTYTVAVWEDVVDDIVEQFKTIGESISVYYINQIVHSISSGVTQCEL